MYANIAPNSDASENSEPVRVEPIFLMAKYTSMNENPTMINPINSRYGNWFSGNVKFSWKIKARKRRENPPMEHFIALTSINSRFFTYEFA